MRRPTKTIEFTEDQVAAISRLLGTEGIPALAMNLLALDGRVWIAIDGLIDTLDVLIDQTIPDHKQEAFKGLKLLLRTYRDSFLENR